MKGYKRNIAGGFAGAIVLNIVHQLMKKITADAPHVDEIGEEAVQAAAEKAGVTPPEGDTLFLTTLTGDIVANSLFYSLIGKGNPNQLFLRGLIYGTVAGMGALALTKPLGLDDEPVNRTTQTKAMTLAWYIIGGLATAAVIRLTEKRR